MAGRGRKCVYTHTTNPPQASSGPLFFPGPIPVCQLEPLYTPANLPPTLGSSDVKNPTIPQKTECDSGPQPASPKIAVPSSHTSAEPGITQPTTPSPPPAQFQRGGSCQRPRPGTARKTPTDPPEARAVRGKAKPEEPPGAGREQTDSSIELR